VLSDDLLHEFDQTTDYGQWLTVRPENPWQDIQWVRVLTKESPSFVSWQQVNVLPVLDTTYLPLPPALRSPFDYAQLEPGDQKITWDEVDSANSYDLQIASDSTFVSILVDETGLNDTQLTVSSLGEDETYFWRVRAANATGKSPWSNTRLRVLIQKH